MTPKQNQSLLVTGNPGKCTCTIIGHLKTRDILRGFYWSDVIVLHIKHIGKNILPNSTKCYLLAYFSAAMGTTRFVWYKATQSADIVPKLLRNFFCYGICN